MKKEIKERWVAALRSGNFRQAQGYLSKNGGYCCLGVLCELAAEDGVVEKGERDEFSTLYDEEGYVLPPAVIAWAGVEDEYGRDSLGLAEKNDHGTPFNEIADIIEKKL